MTYELTHSPTEPERQAAMTTATITITQDGTKLGTFYAVAPTLGALHVEVRSMLLDQIEDCIGIPGRLDALEFTNEMLNNRAELVIDHSGTEYIVRALVTT